MVFLPFGPRFIEHSHYVHSLHHLGILHHCHLPFTLPAPNPSVNLKFKTTLLRLKTKVFHEDSTKKSDFFMFLLANPDEIKMPQLAKSICDQWGRIHPNWKWVTLLLKCKHWLTSRRKLNILKMFNENDEHIDLNSCSYFTVADIWLDRGKARDGLAFTWGNTFKASSSLSKSERELSIEI